MFDSLTQFLMLILLLVALKRLGRIERQVNALGRGVASEAAPTTEAVTPESFPTPQPQVVTAPLPPIREPSVPEPEAAPAEPLSVPALPPTGHARIDFELRFGRRWAALLGGGIVAFGLALLVRHSIQQGYFPPSVRLAGAALLALIFCAGAEFFRRRRTFELPADAGAFRRIADIPSVLLGTGLSGLFAVAYAAHAVYGFLSSPTAFAVMALTALAGIGVSLIYGPALAVIGYLAALAVPFLIVGDGLFTGAAYVALVGVAGYAAAWRGGWKRLENLAGLILLGWAGLLWPATLLPLALVALPGAALAIAITAIRLRPREAWASERVSGQACLALAIAGGQGLLLATHVVRTPSVYVFQPVATALGITILLACLAIAATMTRTRLVAPLVATLIAGLVAVLCGLSVRLDTLTPVVIGLSPDRVGWIVAILSVAILAIVALAMWRSRRVATTAFVGAVSAAILLPAADLLLHQAGGLDGAFLAGLACAQGIGLLAIARPRLGTIPGYRAFASSIVASLGLGLLGFALVVSGLGGGSLVTLVLALVAAGAGALAIIWRMPLFASVAGLAAVPVIVHAGLNAVRTLGMAHHQGGTALWPILQDTLLPGLVLLCTVALLNRWPGPAAIRRADRRWLLVLKADVAAAGTGLPVSLILTALAAGGLLLGAAVATVRFVTFGDAYAPLSAPGDIGLLSLFLLSGAAASLRLHRASGMAGFSVLTASLSRFAVAACAGAILANPFVTEDPVGLIPGLNLLVLAYLLPALAAWRLAREAASMPPETVDSRLRGRAGGMAVAGLLAYATCAVSQAFQGPVLSLDGITETELWTHTLVWLVLGTAILGYGLRTGARVARLTALGIVAAVAAKVTLLDLAHLTGAARALSVIALGLVLLGIGMVYQRLAARDARA
ncbi:DUF2339 domain-containing protein [Methylobacterium sp. NFXW15]|uniref:DUF2339 domain-containing protein n=1 Tax=Methylobacterium sp. NFXW15 TaxID=2819512 RepID=UPI003CFA8A5E